MKDFNGQIVVRRFDDGSLGHVVDLPLIAGVQCVEVNSDRDIRETWEFDDVDFLELSPACGQAGNRVPTGESGLAVQHITGSLF